MELRHCGRNDQNPKKTKTKSISKSKNTHQPAGGDARLLLGLRLERRDGVLLRPLPRRRGALPDRGSGLPGERSVWSDRMGKNGQHSARQLRAITEVEIARARTCDASRGRDGRCGGQGRPGWWWEQRGEVAGGGYSGCGGQPGQPGVGGRARRIGSLIRGAHSW